MIEEFLSARGALDLDHPGGTLLAHLRRTHDTLTAWGARPELRRAGLAHAAYGTDGFPHGLVALSERPAIVDLIGAEAEAIVYLYCACDRAFSYPLLSAGEPRLRDRFTGTVLDLDPQRVRDFVELTIANELDVLSHNEDLRDRHGESLHRLFTACRQYATPSANAAHESFFA